MKKPFFTKKRLIWGVIVILVVGLISYNIYRSKNDTSNIVTESVRVQDLEQAVLATGQVVSTTDLSLSFKVSGVIKNVNVKIGGKAKQGQVLATLEQKDQLASLTSARGALASAQANYQKTLDGASNEEIDVAQKAVDAARVTLDNTKSQQELAVSNAYRTLLNNGLSAIPSAGNSNTAALVVSGTYNGTQEGSYTLTQQGHYFHSTGLETNGDVDFSSLTPIPVGTRGLYVTFPSGYQISSDTWTIEIPNTKGVNYLANLNAYNTAKEGKTAAIASAQAALDSAIATLNLKKAQARPADLKVAQAQILSAQGQVEAAQAALENTVIRAPGDGTITKVNIKPGELGQALQEAIILQDVDNLYLEANISEANVALVTIDQPINVTYDALGPDREFVAAIASIEPASNVVSGVVNYKVTAAIDQLPEIKPGMTANMTIQTASRTGVIAVPQRAVIQRDNKKFVRVINDPKKKTYTEVQVSTGLEANGGLVEVTNGLSEGAEIITFIGEK